MTLETFLEQFEERFAEWQYGVKQDMLNRDFPPEMLSLDQFTFYEWMDDLRNNI